VTYAGLADALSAAMSGLELLPLSKTELRWARAMLTSPEAEIAAADGLRRNGVWVLPYQVGIAEKELVIRLASGSSDGEERESCGERADPPDPR
jgi:hypothetical protein